ncbi:MAG: M20/M25/M40 family metallo-hydrolase [Verrucomicrobiota bacterium]
MAVILFAGLGIHAIWAPSPQTELGKGKVFSVNRATAHIQQIAREPHPVGAKAHDQVLGYVVKQLRALSLAVQVQGATNDTLRLTNVLARCPKPAGTNVVLFVAHYDSVPTGPGAADDGAGVATLLETARLVAAEAPGKNEVAFLFTDGEEMRGSPGASAFIKDNGEFLKHVRVVLNFEARGNRGPVVMFETGPHNLGLMRLLQACPYPVATSFAQDVYHRMPNDTDLSQFLAAGLTGYNFAVIMGLEAYHRPEDNWQNLDRRSLAHYGSYATTLAGRLAQADLDSLRSSQDGIFFPLVRGILVVYPASWAFPLAAGTCVVYGVVMILGLARRRVRIGHVLLGIACALGVPVVMALIASLGLKVLRALFNHVADTSTLVLVSHTFTMLSLALTVLGVLALKSRLSRRLGANEMLAGALVVWLVLAVITALWLRGLSYFFLWPALSGTAALWIVSRQHPSSLATANAALLGSLAPGCVLFAPAMLLAYHALTIALLPVLVGLTSHLMLLARLPEAGAGPRAELVRRHAHDGQQKT